MKRGEVRWHQLHSPNKRRPILILTRDSLLEYLGEVTIAPITSAVRDISSEVFFSDRDGMRGECTINCDRIQTVSRAKTGSLITTLPAEKREQVREAILFPLRLK